MNTDLYKCGRKMALIEILILASSCPTKENRIPVSFLSHPKIQSSEPSTPAIQPRGEVDSPFGKARQRDTHNRSTYLGYSN